MRHRNFQWWRLVDYLKGETKMVRPDQYPDGSIIPVILPNSYQAANTAMVPRLENCFECAAYKMESSTCGRWYGVPVKQGYWCAAFARKI